MPQLFVSPQSRRPSSRYFPFIGCSGGDTQCPSVISYPADVTCPGPLPSTDLFNHACDLYIFYYPDVWFLPLITEIH